VTEAGGAPVPHSRKLGCDEQLAVLLARGWSVARAAKKAGASESTVRRRLRDLDFLALVDERRAQVRERVMGLLSRPIVKAARVNSRAV
jgi:hypothetical protein